jgi:hypothetical protein
LKWAALGQFQLPGRWKWKGSKMAKFYVQSGLFEIVVQAGDGEGAALWAVHRYLHACDRASQQLFEVRRFRTGSDAESSQAVEVQDWVADSTLDPPDLAETIQCSEVGFGRRDAGVYLTSEVLQKYTELLTALASLGV